MKQITTKLDLIEVTNQIEKALSESLLIYKSNELTIDRISKGTKRTLEIWNENSTNIITFAQVQTIMETVQPFYDEYSGNINGHMETKCYTTDDLVIRTVACFQINIYMDI